VHAKDGTETTFLKCNELVTQAVLTKDRICSTYWWGKYKLLSSLLDQGPETSSCDVMLLRYGQGCCGRACVTSRERQVS
jgi:hypothetical protein